MNLKEKLSKINLNKKLFLKIYIPIVIILAAALIILQILGSKSRVGYLSEFDLLETNYNENTTNYIYHFKIGYYNKTFKHSDIYGVYPNLSNLPEFVKEIKMDEAGSPFGNLISDRIIEEEKIEINYTLKVKPTIFYIIFMFIIILLINLAIFIDEKLNILNINGYNEYNKFNDKFCIIFLLLFVFIIMFFSLKLYNFHKYGLLLNYEIYGDQSQFLSIASMVKNEGWAPIPTDRLGAPFGRYLGTYSMFLLMNFEIILIKIISIFIENPYDILQISWLLIFPITAIVSYYVMRNLNISKFMSIFGSLIFTFVQYVFSRQTTHYNYATIYFIPLTVLLCVWLFKYDDLLMPNKNLFKTFKTFKIFKNKRNIIAIIFTLLIANNGGGYYQFFSCFFIIITAISKLLKTKNIKLMPPFIISISSIMLFFILNFVPLFVYKLGNNTSVLNNQVRGWGEAEYFGFKISHLFFNPKFFGDYYQKAIQVNENITEYSGIVVIAGFLGLILYLFANKTYKKQTVLLLSELNISAVLLATIGGFATLFNYYVSPIIRAYNRISIYIAYICILAFCIFIDKYFSKKKNIAFYTLFSIILIITLCEQIPDSGSYNINQINKYTTDREFIENIEKIMPKNSSIYQLPTVGFYNGFAEKIPNGQYYRNFIGYIFSKNLKWSEGFEPTKQEYYKIVNKMNAVNLLNELSYSGFDGIYIDKYLYGDNINSLENDLINILGEPIVTAEDGNLVFFSLIDFKENKKENKLDKNYKPLINNYLSKSVGG